MAPTLTTRTSKPVSPATAKQRMLKQLVCSDAPEQALRLRGFVRIAGVDEVGRGALFGPVVAAAVILPECMDTLAEAGLKDSKQLPREAREELDALVRGMALAVSVAEVDAATIDQVNIYQATRMVMHAAVQGLAVEPDHLLIDAMRLDHPCSQTKLIYGDALSLSIAAASVVAKVYRDALMRKLDEAHPGYGLASHKGYGTAEHRRALREFGPTALHRKTFAPVRATLQQAILGEQAVSNLLFNDMETGEWD
ncbi:ribonuclease HII [Edaphobacter sp.]|uniref:ribonuclease HII n=1 Tax=Edaphobacter sp. TaxID=1934404 RepID=UPI002DBEF5D4|nr:ribonuclease HII [Edaphobacter sp.]HEU5342452.1 ribonuclease HII [Edaphobacter sp.]